MTRYEPNVGGIVIPVDRGWVSVEATGSEEDSSSASSTRISRRSATRRSARRRPRS